MSKRTCYVFGFLVALAIALTGVIVYVIIEDIPRPGVTKVNFDRIEDGMTLADVERILGKATTVDTGRIPPGPNWFQWARWKEQDCEIVVKFRWDWGSGETSATPDRRFTKEHLSDKLRRWLNI